MLIVIHLYYFVLSVLYSSKVELLNSSCDFWCAILSSGKEVSLFVMFTLGNISLIKMTSWYFILNLMPFFLIDVISL